MGNRQSTKITDKKIWEYHHGYFYKKFCPICRENIIEKKKNKYKKNKMCWQRGYLGEDEKNIKNIIPICRKCYEQSAKYLNLEDYIKTEGLKYDKNIIKIRESE